eukprot:TRINITY_DN18497_c0_g1_i1.p1 TRINITY_DN18497_c0_g1~~TRINITY_DN18497_c0_g1_i1.p1  ORF type:complete len:695 (+),score=148.92 TRINITY_DN18497_c0_g1_i1:58-2142(+)
MLRTSLYDSVVAERRVAVEAEAGLGGTGRGRQARPRKQQYGVTLPGADGRVADETRSLSQRSRSESEASPAGLDEAREEAEREIAVRWDTLPVVTGPMRLRGRAAAAGDLMARPLTPSNPVLTHILSPEPPRPTPAAPCEEDFEACVATPRLDTSALEQQLAALQTELNNLALSTRTQPQPQPDPEPAVELEPAAPPAAKGLNHFARNRRALCKQIKMRKEHVNVPLLRAQRREVHRQAVARRREEAIVQKIEASVLAQELRQMRDSPPTDGETPPGAGLENTGVMPPHEPAREAHRRARQIWQAAVLACTFVWNTRQAHTELVTHMGRLRTSHAARVLQRRLLPLFRRYRRRLVRGWVQAVCTAGCMVVRWKRVVRDRRVDRVRMFLRSFVADKSLAIRQYVAMIRKTRRMAADVVRARRGRLAAMEHWFRLIEGWVILSDAASYVALLPPDGNVNVHRARAEAFVRTARRLAPSLPFDIACSVGEVPPLMQFRALQPPEPLIRNCTPFEHAVRARCTARRWNRLRDYVYCTFSRRRRTRERRLQQLQENAAGAPPGHTDRGGHAPPVAAPGVTRLRAAPPDPDPWDVLPFYLRPLRLPAGQRREIIAQVLRTSRARAQQQYMRQLVSYKLTQRLKHLECLPKEAPPTLRALSIVNAGNEREVVRRVRAILDDKALQCHVASAGRPRGQTVNP